MIIPVLLKVKNIRSYKFMVHICKFRYLSFIQVKCNWYRTGTIVLTVKRNNCKTVLQEAASRFILQKIVQCIQLQIYSGNPQQRAFTPVKFAKQTY